LGSADGCEELGYFYQSGAVSLAKDITMAVSYFKKSCDMSNTSACGELKDMIAAGILAE